MADSQPTISTHVLDTGSGRPATGVRVTLYRLADGGSDGPATELNQTLTNADGRVPDLVGGPLEPGFYRLRTQPRDGSGSFFRSVSVEFEITDVSRSYHVPLLLAPFGLTTYLGS